MYKNRSNFSIAAFCVASMAISALNAAHADTIAFTPPVLNSFGNEPTGNDGEFFTPTTAISVTALGYVNPGSALGNVVGLYDVSTATLLASTIVTSSSPASGAFLYEAITPVSLTAGNEYAVVGLYVVNNGAVGYTADSGVGAAPEITFDGYAYDYNNVLDLPTTAYTPSIFGPDFQYTVTSTSVPEPTSVGCCLLGLGLFGCFQRLKTARRI